MPESLLIKCQAGDLQPYLKRDLDIFFPVNVEEFSKGQLLNQSNISSNIKKCHVERNVGPV